MFYAEISLAVAATVICLVIFFYNIVKKSRSSCNTLLAAAGLASAALSSLIIINRLDIGILTPALAQKIILSLLMLVGTLVFAFFWVYPYTKPGGIIIALIAGIPGYLVSGITAASSVTLAEPARAGSFAGLIGSGYPAYLLTVTLYLLATLIVILYKAGQHANRALRNDLLYLLAGLIVLFPSFLVPAVYLEYFGGITDFSTTSVLPAVPLILIIMNYAASDYSTIDMKKFYARAFYWLITILLLLAPTLLMIKYNTRQYLQEKIPSLALAFILFLYLFTVFKYIRPRIADLFERGRRNLITRLDQLFNDLKRVTENIKQEEYWDNFFEALAGGFAAAFGIRNAYCFLYNKKENKFITAFGTGEKIPDVEILSDHPLLTLLSRTPGIVYKPALHFPGRPDDGNSALEFFERNRLEVILPCYNPEKEMIGLIALGQLRGNKIYTKSFLSALELYRIQFQHHLANALMLEQVRATQVIKHDQIVVSSIKNKIIPHGMSQLRGYRISSLYVNNSPYGGDYFDSMPVDENRIALFISDASYSGIDSAIISLELYSVLHSHAKLFDSPNKILNMMNWVIGSSVFSNKYAQAFCAILSSSGELSYSNAAFNPLLVYSPDADTITECDIKGLPVGVNKKSMYESKTIQLNPGSAGILYSDGLVTAINDNGEAYSIDRVQNVLRRARETGPADLVKIIHADLQHFIKEKKQINDMSVIAFKFQ
ncbi:MAG: hypothetical protein A2W19_15025 [Spirochaetes bacterium RBG_16_49_21]|nr:MAG: hypothetical protein A2W19_15025 [Spirochaetes bacterium RBG_16_49_21]